MPRPRVDHRSPRHYVGQGDGSLIRQSASIAITGNATIADFAFPLAAIHPGAVDRMLSSARKLSGAGDFRATALGLLRGLSTGSRALAWTINAEGGGRNLTYRADADERQRRPRLPEQVPVGEGRANRTADRGIV